jgi:23S rRNA pseudouridine955/2504/2580 synthase
MPHPRGGILEVTAPLPPHMLETFRFLGFTPDHAGSFDAFDE